MVEQQSGVRAFEDMEKKQINMHPGLAGGPIYLDYNATTPVDPVVVDALLPYLDMHFGNPSSSHSYGQRAHEALNNARQQVASLLHGAPQEIVFSGCGSESDTLAIRGAALARRRQGGHIITQVTEHPAVLNVCQALERLHDYDITYLPVDGSGRIDLSELEASINEQTILISIMHANNETGTLQPLAEISEIARRHRILFHTDAAQSVGKVAINVKELGVDLLSFAGHKLYAPKGIGALYVREGIQLEPAIYGGGQEAGRRAGTENIAYIVALGKACELAQEQLGSMQSRVQPLRDRLQALLEASLPGSIHLNGHRTERLPNTLNLSIDDIVGEEVLRQTPEIASSTGSACHEGNTEPSAVLSAMGLSRERALAALRLTLGRWTSEEQIEEAAALLARSIKALRKKC